MNSSIFTMESPVGARVQINGKCVDYFCGTAYFAMQNHPDVINAACAAAQNSGMGAATSRASFGDLSVLHNVEQRAAQFLGTESSLYFSSGYLGAGILLNGLSADYDCIFADRQSHSAIIDGIVLSQKRSIFFEHCNAKDLALKLRQKLKPNGHPLIITDGVFPTTGEIAPLKDYKEIIDDYPNARLCVDDAHATGLIGASGRGSFEYFNIEGDDCYTTTTCSKALGGFGGIITGKRSFIDYLKTHSKIIKGASSVPTPSAAATARSLEILARTPEIRSRLWENVSFAKNAFRDMGFQGIADTPVPIIPLNPKGVDLEKLQTDLLAENIAVQYIAPGSYSNVPNTGLLRIVICSEHTKDQIGHLTNTLKRKL